MKYLVLALLILNISCVTTKSSTKKAPPSPTEKFAQNLAKRFAAQVRQSGKSPTKTMTAQLCIHKGTKFAESGEFLKKLQQSLEKEGGWQITKTNELPGGGWHIRCVTNHITVEKGGKKVRMLNGDLRLYSPEDEVTAMAGGETRWKID